MTIEQRLCISPLSTVISDEISRLKHPRGSRSMAQAIIDASVELLPPKLGTTVSFVIGPLVTEDSSPRQLQDTLLEVAGSAARFWETPLVFTNLDLLTRKERVALGRIHPGPNKPAVHNPEQVQRFSWMINLPSIRKIILVPDAEDKLPWLKRQIIRARQAGGEVWEAVKSPGEGFQFRMRSEPNNIRFHNLPSTFLHLGATNLIE